MSWALYEKALDTCPVVKTVDRDDAPLGAPVLVRRTSSEQ
jgi:hypothetical protein